MNRVAQAALPLALLACMAATTPAAVRETWHDAARDRDVPVKIDVPADAAASTPVVILSHGLGGSREGLVTIGQYWADHGYVVVHLQHAGSDESIWRGVAPRDLEKSLRAGQGPAQLVARVGDVKFALDEIARRNADPNWPLHGKLDLARVAMAGHSFGAITTQAMCGQRAATGLTAFDPRLKVGIAFSPFPPAAGDMRQAFGAMRVPMFYWTGTEDRVPIVAPDYDVTRHRIPFDSTDGIDQYLVVLTGADHMYYNGHPRGKPATTQDAAWLDLIGRGTTAFLDKYLRGDAAQAKYLDGGPFADAVKPLGTFERKAAKRNN
jgi:predicted esterase